MRLPSKPNLFVSLMVASAISAFVLPMGWTSWLRKPIQVIELLQWPFRSLARSTTEAISGSAASRQTQLEHEVETLRLQLGQQEEALANFQRLLDDATGLRGQMPDQQFKIILAPIVAFDANPRRDTLSVVLNADQVSWVRAGQWVAAGEWDTPTRERLARQWLIGRVVEVQTRSARIELTTDVNFKSRVNLGRFEGTSPERPVLLLGPDLFRLDGAGGRMSISQAPGDFYGSGDRLVFAPASRELPFPMVLGRLTGATQDTRSAKHYELAVEPWGSVRKLTHVYIISAEP